MRRWGIVISFGRSACCLAFFLGSTGPALAGTSVALPDPSGLTLFSLGVAGLIFGRKAASKRRNHD